MKEITVKVPRKGDVCIKVMRDEEELATVTVQSTGYLANTTLTVLHDAGVTVIEQVPMG